MKLDAHGVKDPIASAFDAGVMDGLALIVDHSDEGRAAMSDLLKKLGASDEEAASKWHGWMRDDAKYLAFPGGTQARLLTVRDAEQLTVLIAGIVARCVEKGASVYISRAVSKENLEEVKKALSAGNELAVQRVQQASRPEGLSWLHGSYEGVNVQLRRGTEGEICLVELDAAAIESKQTAGLVQLLRAMVSEAAPIKRSRGLVSMFTSAFDHDHRSVEDIPRMQAFVADVVAQCPWWMHVMWGEDVEMDNTKWWVVSMTQRLKPTEYGRDGSARMHVDTHSMRAVMMAGLQGCAHLYERACEKGWMSESEGGEMLDDVSAQVLAWKARLVGDSAG